MALCRRWTCCRCEWWPRSRKARFAMSRMMTAEMTFETMTVYKPLRTIWQELTSFMLQGMKKSVTVFSRNPVVGCMALVPI